MDRLRPDELRAECSLRRSRAGADQQPDHLASERSDDDDQPGAQSGEPALLLAPTPAAVRAADAAAPRPGAAYRLRRPADRPGLHTHLRQRVDVRLRPAAQIGRATCRERGWQYV